MDCPSQIQSGQPATIGASGREIKVYDDSRQPREWHKLLAPLQGAVFFKRVNSEAPLSPNGFPVARLSDCTFLLFDTLAEARQFSEARVQELPEMCCEIFDSRGRAVVPLLVVMHPSVAKDDEMSASSVRKRTIVAAFLFVGSLPLIWWDWHSGSGLVLPTLIGINMIFAGLRLLQWNTARGQRIKEQEKRLQDHLNLAKEIGCDVP
jgi:hypothetical protein